MTPERKLRTARGIRAGAFITGALGLASAAAGGMGFTDNIPRLEGFEQYRAEYNHTQIIPTNVPTPSFSKMPMPDRSVFKVYGTLVFLLSMAVAAEAEHKIRKTEKRMRKLEAGKKVAIVRRREPRDIRYNATVAKQLEEIEGLDEISGIKPPRKKRRERSWEDPRGLT